MRASRRTTADLSEAPTAGDLKAFSFLDAGVGLAVVSASLPKRRTIRCWLLDDDRDRRIEAVCISLSSEEPTALLVLRPQSAGEALPSRGDLLLSSREGPIALEPRDIRDAEVSLKDLAARHLGGLDAERREAVLEQIVEVVSRGQVFAATSSRGLGVLRDATRPHLHRGELTPAAECAVNIEGLWRVDDRSFYVEGWLLDRASDVSRLVVVSPEGRRVDVLSDAYRYPRPDVCEFFGVSPRDELGFVTHLELPEPTLSTTGWLLQAHRTEGEGIEIDMPAVEDGGPELRTTILHDLTLERLPEESLRIGHIWPALTRLERRLADAVQIDAEDQHGAPPPAPEVSIVVPLYRRVEFLEQQLAQFVHDPEIRESDLIYILDSPEDAGYLRRLAGELFRLYGVPFRLATLSENGGFSVVNNLGASLARAPRLLLLNSDVLPARPGWLSRMVEFYDANPAMGALAPKLLYEDDSIQHAGIYFDRPPGAPTWSNEHYFKGLHRSFAAANVARQVPAVTGACLMIDAELYRHLGGLRGMFVRGDYEDTDLCLRLREMGREIWYLPDVELYHLEGQSYPSEDRQSASKYNEWLHTYIWRDALAVLEDEA